MITNDSLKKQVADDEICDLNVLLRPLGHFCSSQPVQQAHLLAYRRFFPQGMQKAENLLRPVKHPVLLTEGVEQRRQLRSAGLSSS